MKHGATFALVVFTILALSAVGLGDVDAASGQTVTIDGITYELADDNTAALKKYNKYGDLVIPSTIEYDGVEYTVGVIDITIPKDTLTSLTVPGTVKEICAESFLACRNLKSLTLNEGLEIIGIGAFSQTSIMELAIPSTVTWIDNGAFSATQISNVTIPADVAGLHGGAFIDCPNLKTIEVEEGNKYYKSEDNTVYTIDGKKLIFHVGGVESFIIPDGVEQIGFCAFYADEYLRDVTIPASVDTIQSSAFTYCTALESVVIPEGVTILQVNVFSGCASLSSVTLPDSLEGILEGAFYDTALTEVSFGSKLSYINHPFTGTPISKISISKDNSVFTVKSNVLFSKDGSTLIWYPEARAGDRYVVPSDVKTVETFAFYSTHFLKAVEFSAGAEIDPQAFAQSSVEEVVLPSDLKVLQRSVFYMCENLKDVEIPETVEMIGYDCFGGCTSLERITVPASVTFMEDSVFDGCTSLVEVEFLAQIEEIPAATFNGCTALKSFTVPEAVTKVGTATFAGCTALETVNLGYAMVDPLSSTHPFDGCVSLKTITVAEDNDVMEVVDGVLFFKDSSTLVLFPMADERTEYVVPEGTVEIGKFSFKKATNLVSVTVPDTVEFIGESAFEDCASLTSISLGKNVAEFVGNTWLGCTSLKDVTVSDENDMLGVEDGVLFLTTNTDKMLVLYPAAREGSSYTIPSGVNTIVSGAFAMSNLVTIDGGADVVEYRDMAFYECEQLKSIAMSPNLISIGVMCFYGCESLESIDIPSSVLYIYAQAFVDCPGMKQMSINSEVNLVDNGVFAFGADPSSGTVTPVKVKADVVNGYIIPYRHVAYNGDLAADITYGAVSTFPVIWVVVVVIALLAVVGAVIIIKKRSD